MSNFFVFRCVWNLKVWWPKVFFSIYYDWKVTFLLYISLTFTIWGQKAKSAQFTSILYWNVNSEFSFPVKIWDLHMCFRVLLSLLCKYHPELESWNFGNSDFFLWKQVRSAYVKFSRFTMRLESHSLGA